MAKLQFRTLDKLPPELIVQIASKTTPETVLALAQVSKLLRQTCYDSLVFLDSFYSHTWAKEHLGGFLADVDLVARYAVAESRYLQFIENEKTVGKLETGVIPNTSELLRYLPNLVMLNSGVPTLDRSFLLGRRLIFKAGFPDEEGLKAALADLDEKRSIVSLMIACGLLRIAPFIPSSSSLDEQLHDHNAITFYTYDNLANGIRRQTATYVQRFHDDNLVGVGKMATLLACAFPDHTKNPDLPSQYLSAGPRHSTHVNIPSISKIPLALSPTDIPVPFLPISESLSSWRRWIQRQRSIQSSPEYLDSGEWVGMYTFTTHGPLTAGGGFFSAASGIDGVGEFDISVTTDSHGYIRGRKSYKHHPTSWSWYLSNTPFGLYGLWATEREIGEIGMLGGAVWLWKREWCA
ncbi:hypothetical protein, variant [Verruconis gallopava]|uniref:F-box domain-containing protein n=1 Tax=Verruconis gallopava TaxID=253628 RepID=A0A0D2AS29_9PEZI|nr:hypothetical protein, variant [Verruconis gallopava]KIW09350.1 hypothetical protein, variant [Verruconis gallopava]